VGLKHSFAGNLSFTLTGGSFRSRANGQGNNGACAIRNNSSNSISDVPAGATVVKAFLYWAGSGAPDYQISLNNQSVFADIDSRHSYTMDANRNFYGASADVTSRVSGNGSFTIRDLNIDTSNDYCQTETVLGAWALAVIYEAPSEDFRVVNVYEGFQGFSGDTPNLVLSPSNFKVSNNPSGKHAHITWEGDDSLTAGGENLEFEGNLLFDSNNPIGNQFNSYSNVQGGFTSYGLDVDAYDIDSLLNPGAEQVTTRYSSGQDLVILSAELISVSNVPVADLQIQNLSSNSAWDKNAPQSLSFRLTNNGPANVNAFDTRFELQLPANTSYSGPAPVGFNCSATSTIVTCERTTAFPANSSIDILLNIDATAVDTSSGLVNATFSASIDHDLANSPDLFDNRQFNNSVDLTQNIGQLNYNNSSILLTDGNAGLLLAGDPINAEITLGNGGLLDSNGASITIDMPSGIESFSVETAPTGFNVTTLPDGGANGTGQIIINDIDFLSSENPIIQLSLNTDPATDPDAELSLTGIINDNNQSWSIASNILVVSDGTLPASGNKQIYLNTGSSMSRERPENLSDTIDIARGASQTWDLTPALLGDLTFSLDDILLEVTFSGNGIRGTFFPRPSQADYDLEIEVISNNQILASRNVTIAIDNDTTTTQSLALNNLLNSTSTTINPNDSLQLRISNNSDVYQVSEFLGIPINIDPNEVTLHVFDGDDTSLQADGFSALILDAQTVINIDSIDVWSAPFEDNDNDGIDDSGAQPITNSQPDTQLSVRATVSDPFGAFDITSAFITIDNANISNQLMVEVDDKIDNKTTATKTYETIFTLAEEDETIGNWNISVIANEGEEGDVSHTRSSSFMVLPFQPDVDLTKTIEVINDPINGPLAAGNNPKAIPGAEIQYTITAINEGRGQSDDNSIRLQDEIPQNAELFIGDLTCSNRGPGIGLGPICFKDGATPNESGLTYDFTSITDLSDDIAFSVDGSDFSYEPSDEGDGYDSNVRFIRISPRGELLNASKDGTEQPEFSFKYQVRLQ